MIIAIAVLFVFLLLKEIRRRNRDRLLLRILAVLAVLGGLVLLVFPLKYKVDRNRENNELRLLTKGAAFPKDTLYYTLDSNVLKQFGTRQITYLPDLAYYLRTHPEISRIKVYGYGLAPGELDKLKGYRFEFRPAVLPAGVISCSWPRQLKQTALLEVQGNYNNTGDRPVQLFLEGLGAKSDSIIIGAHARAHFSLKGQPKQMGRAVYTLAALSGTDTLEKEKIPFEVLESPKIKVLVLSSFPDFEYKFLKNWLFENKYPVVFRTRISRDKFSMDQLNTPALNVAEMNAGTPGKFDLVIADDEELSKSGPAVLNGLRNAISQGLGLLIRLNDVKPVSSLAKQFNLYTVADSTAKSFTPVFQGETAGLKPLPGLQPFYISARPAAQELVKDQSGKILLSSGLYGNGRLAASAISSTYHWILSGDQFDYARFWSAVISSITRKEDPSPEWSVVPALPVTGQQTAIHYTGHTTGNMIPAITAGQTRLSPLQHTELPFSWKADFWPSQTGWNELKTETGPTGYFFVFDNQDWKTLKDSERLLANLSHAKNTAVKTADKEVQTETIEKEVPAWWFFILFLLGAAYLWFETKLL